MAKVNLLSIVARVERLEAEVFEKKDKLKRNVPKGGTRPDGLKLDFSVNIRAFARRYVSSKSGPKKFVLLLSYITGGKIGKKVMLGDITKEWKKMSAKNLLGNFNRFYPNEAKTQGWVNSTGYGTYCLTDSWHEANE